MDGTKSPFVFCVLIFNFRNVKSFSFSRYTVIMIIPPYNNKKQIIDKLFQNGWPSKILCQVKKKKKTQIQKATCHMIPFMWISRKGQSIKTKQIRSCQKVVVGIDGKWGRRELFEWWWLHNCMFTKCILK